jgi:hypothetical protein
MFHLKYRSSCLNINIPQHRTELHSHSQHKTTPSLIKLSNYLLKHLINRVDQGIRMKYLVKSLKRCLPIILMHCNRNSKYCLSMQCYRFKRETAEEDNYLPSSTSWVYSSSKAGPS